MIKKYLILLSIVFICAGFAGGGFQNSKNIFLGEYVSNVNPGSQFVVSATNTLASGRYAVATGPITGSITTTSGTPVAMTSMTVTPAYTGNYDIAFESSVQSTTGGNSITCYIYVNGSAVTNVSITIQFPTATLIDSGYPFYLGCHADNVAVTASTNVQVYWSTSGGTATALNRNLKATKVN